MAITRSIVCPNGMNTPTKPVITKDVVSGEGIEGVRGAHTQSDETTEQKRSHALKVILGLEGEQRQSYEDSEGDKKRLDNDLVVVERNDDAKGEGFK